jgi:class 3 adenylate cyclase
VPGEFLFCPFCGSALAEAPLRRGREERKVITVLFADLVGFTARAERLDPEDVRALLAPYHAHLRSELERFGGTVEKFIGDAVMALFGAPIAHEDDPERAVRAARLQAARLQAAAPLNGVLVGEQAHRATAQAIHYRQAAPVVGKGKREPIRAWEALGARSRFGVDVSRRAVSPLVGRGRRARAAPIDAGA